jgi:hypothetical protein
MNSAKTSVAMTYAAPWPVSTLMTPKRSVSAVEDHQIDDAEIEARR